MVDADKQKFLEKLTLLAGIYQRKLDTPLIQAFWAVLSSYDVQLVMEAFDKHLTSSKFFPMPSEIIELIPHSAHHVGADEAWALTVKSFDELETVVITREMLEAKSVAQDVWDMGDIVGARMAFKDAYTRIIKTAGVPAWQVSVGYDKQRRVEAVKEAIELGRLPKGAEKKYLPDANTDYGAIAGLLSGKVVEMPANNEKLKSKWGELKASLNAGLEALEAEKQRAKQEEIERKQKANEFCQQMYEKQIEEKLKTKTEKEISAKA